MIWKWEDEGEDEDPWGPVWVETFAEGSDRPEKVEKWDRWVRLSEAEEFARARGYEFLED